MYESSSHDSTKLSREKPKKSRGRATRGAVLTFLVSFLLFYNLSISQSQSHVHIFENLKYLRHVHLMAQPSPKCHYFFFVTFTFFSRTHPRELSTHLGKTSLTISHIQHNTHTQTTTEKKKPQEEQIVRKTRFVQGGDRGDSRSVHSFRYGRIRIHRPARIEKRHAISWIWGQKRDDLPNDWRYWQGRKWKHRLRRVCHSSKIDHDEN